jgi:hypothetical protein
LAASAHAQDEYYALSSAVTTTTPAAGNGTALPLSVNGWIETSGYGVTGFQPGCGTGLACYKNLIVAYDVNITFNGTTEIMTGVGSALAGNGAVPGYPVGIVSTPKGLFCNLCAVSNEGFPFFYMGSGRNSTGAGGGAFYQFESGTFGTLDFSTAYLRNNYKIGVPAYGYCAGCTDGAPAAVMAPKARGAAAPELNATGAGAALTLVIGTALVLQGRRHG